ncbi:FAD-dependent monooxygenase [Actinocorallia sp. A-T 12471]|uniref:FAD-dependent monooxygenase n=1 Tax=Actinocorallia sp. A-T 12471 TaxID=3089813 RepID=UPI0029CB8526|nr:FAD-dependent monooxygenase [Actinocorallia sp. A-T 12471]MDX6742282.1 FAD-dependent monooxygenase [Actinocorallia sp. A-T 12471]
MTDVIVVGAGPTGLLLAGDLAEAGVAVTVLERRDGRVSNLSRAFGVHARTLEQLDARGLADRLVATGTPVRRIRLFGGVEVDLGALPSRFPYLLVTPQYNVENLLLERAVEAGARIVHEAEAVGLDQDGDGVTVTTRDASYRAAYAIGTDGFHSAVRRLLGQPFPGRSVLKSIMLADVRLAEAPAETLTVNGVGDAFAFIAPFGDGYHRIFAWDRRPVGEDVPLALAEVRDVTRRALGSDFGMHDPRWLSRFHSDERQVPAYRVGRVFLAGDAAHVHSPAGGQGMNTGLQDAANLSWRLVSGLRGAPDGLLDGYHTERHPVGRAVLRSSGTLIRAAMLRSRPARALRTFMARSALAIPRIRTRLLGEISGIGVAYPRPPGTHPLVGTRAPDLPLTTGNRLYEALRGGHFLLLTSTDHPTLPAHIPTATPTTTPPAPFTLIRPDAYIAWAAQTPTTLTTPQ